MRSLSMNYVALLKETEEELLRFQEENLLLKDELAISAATEIVRAPAAPEHVNQLEETVKNLERELQSNQKLFQEHVAALEKQHQEKLESLSVQREQDLASALVCKSQSSHLISNGPVQSNLQDSLFQKNSEIQRLQDREKELKNQLLEKDEIYTQLRNAHDMSISDTSRMEELLLQEKKALSQKNLQLQRDHEATEAAMREADMLRSEMLKKLADSVVKEKEALSKLCIKSRRITGNMEELHKRLKMQEKSGQEFQIVLTKLEKQNADLLEERNALQKALDVREEGTPEMISTEAEKDLNGFKGASLEIERLTERLKVAEETCAANKAEFQKELELVSSQRDKAARDLARLKQHLLDMELADSEKMDQDSEHIADLQARAEAGLARALHAEQALSQALSELAEAKRHMKEELRSATEEIENLQQKLSSCVAAIELKDVELSNLQSALGQYYAESDAQDRLYMELSASREEIGLLSQQLQMANQKIDAKNTERDIALEKLASAELRIIENQGRLQKLEDEVVRLRRALEQSMTRLNSLSSDSDYHVDRRIVIKLLVTYFQRNHSREVLDLMVRMLGFSEDDKRRVGLAQQAAGRGVVRGVLGLPGRFVGGLIGSASADSLTLPTPTDNQSFADLWIDFLLKESEERERREKAEASAKGDADMGRNGSLSMSSEHIEYSPGVLVKGSVSVPPSPGRFISHRTSSSFSDFMSSLPSPKDPAYRSDIAAQLPSETRSGPVLVSQSSDVIGNEFSSISLVSSSATSNTLSSLGHQKLPPRT